MQKEIEFDDRRWSYKWWTNERLVGTVECPLSIDTETTLIKAARDPLPGEDPDDVPLDPLDVPQVALAMACDSKQLVLIHPSKLRSFVAAHRTQHAVAHNLAFDWHVLRKDAQQRKDAVTEEFLWQWAETGRLHDSMLMDMLLQLATGRFRRIGSGGGEQKLYPTNLAVLCDEWGCGELDKTDPFRTKFGNFVGLTEQEIEAYPESEKYFEYALKDVLACHAVFQKQRVRGLELMRRAGWNPDPKTPRYEMRPDCVEKFGVLSEKVQVCAAIVLAELSRTPIRIDLERRQKLEDAARERHSQYLQVLIDREPELVRRKPAKYRTITEGKGKTKTKTKVLVEEEKVVYTAKAGVPSFNNSVLLAVLHDEAARLQVDVPISKGKEKRVSLSAKQWKYLSDRSDFIKAWCSLEEEGKRIEDLCKINAPEVYSKYDLLKVTGRTGSGQYADGRSGRLLRPSLNIQNVKRDNPKTPELNMRPLFLAPEGHLFAAVDYGYIEFRAMAAVAKAMYGYSKMAEVTIDHTLHSGPDPHEVTAASVEGVTVEQFKAMDKDRQKKLRQEYGKSPNFALMGGMGVHTFCEYCKTLGFTLTPQRAKEVKRAWKDLYPEMKEYLTGSSYEGLLWETETKAGPRLNDQQAYRLSKFLKTTEGDDPDYAPDEDDGGQPTWNEKELFWSVLEWAAKRKGDEQTQEDVRRRRVTHRVRKLTYYRSCTLTGRIRNYCSYTEERNGRFQGCSADGAKMAMFRLMRKGYKLLAFIHDEITIALPSGKAERMVKEVERIMVAEMENVLGQGVPVAVASEIAPCWSKG